MGKGTAGIWRPSSPYSRKRGVYMSFLSNILTGVSLGSIYAIIALGYTMVYGIAKMLNFAHGDVIMVGAFMCFFATGRYGLPPLVSVLLAVVVCTALGIIIEGLAYKPLREAPSLAVLITAIGVSYLLQNGAQLLWGADTKTFTPIVSGSLSLAGGRLNISYVSLLAMACCLVVMVCLTFFTNRTRMGKAMRACSEDKGAAQLMGINVNSTISMTFAIGSALAAGSLCAPPTPSFPPPPAPSPASGPLPPPCSGASAPSLGPSWGASFWESSRPLPRRTSPPTFPTRWSSRC